MKLAIVLFVILGYSALMFTNATQKKTPTPRPTPTPAKTPAKQTPTPKPSATPTPKPSATPTPAPTTTPTPSTPTTATGAKEPCESVVQASGIPLCGRVEPKTVVLAKGSTRAKPEVFSHEAHATLKYSADGTKVMSCAECHHTDQPSSSLSGLLKTSHRDVMLTTASLAAAGAKPVLACHACHAQEGKRPDICDPALGGARYKFCPNIPAVTYPDESDETVLTSEEAYHRNCITCHNAAIEAHKKPGAPKFIKASPPVNCADCHKGP